MHAKQPGLCLLIRSSPPACCIDAVDRHGEKAFRTIDVSLRILSHGTGIFLLRFVRAPRPRPRQFAAVLPCCVLPWNRARRRRTPSCETPRKDSVLQKKGTVLARKSAFPCSLTFLRAAQVDGSGLLSKDEINKMLEAFAIYLPIDEVSHGLQLQSLCTIPTAAVS